MVHAANKHGVPLGILYAIGLTETGRGRKLQPYALNIDGRSNYAVDLQNALRRFWDARRSGAKYIDVGCMQINYYYHSTYFRSIDEMFDPRKNVDYAAGFLGRLKAQTGTWTQAVGRYHAGSANVESQTKYVCKVVANMIASGFGGWTASARALCRKWQ